MRFSRDRRGQSVVIGTVILFGFLILALSLYQVQVVPQQNGQAEFEHFEEVQNDLVELRAAILEEGSSDRPQYETVRLGTTYPTRIFAVNPPSPAGTIRTVESPPITVAYSNGTVIETIPTRFLQYRPGYNEIDASPTWYDASTLYVDARHDGGGIAVIEDQALVENGEVQIVALQNEFRRSGTNRVTIELHSAEDVTKQLPEGNLIVTVPTRLSGEEYWNTTEANISNDVYGGVTESPKDDIYNLTLKTTAANLTVDTVGVQAAPEDPIQNGGGTGSDESSGYDGFSAVSASDLPKNEGVADQELSFTVNSTLPSGESVTINLTAAQQGEFDYESSGINSVNGSLNKGSAQFRVQNSNAAEIEYTANQDISSGEQIQLEVSDVSYDNGNKGEYTVTFTRSDGVSATDTFSDTN